MTEKWASIKKIDEIFFDSEDTIIDIGGNKTASIFLEEMKKIDGGWWQEALAVAGAVIYLYNEGGDFIKVFKEGYNSTR